MSFAHAHKDYVKALELDPTNKEAKVRLAQFKPHQIPAAPSKPPQQANSTQRAATMLSDGFEQAELAQRKYMSTNRKVRGMFADRPRIDEPMCLDPKKSKKENEASWKNVSDFDVM